MHVEHFILDPRVGGPHAYVASLRRALPPTLTHRIVTAGRGPVTDVALVNLRRIWKPLYALEVLMNALRVMWMWARRREARTVLHVHGAANLAPLLAAWVLRAPALWLIHETDPGQARWVHLGRRLLDGRRRVVAVVARAAEQAYGLEGARFLPGFVDEDFWSAAHAGTGDRGEDEGERARPPAAQDPLRMLAVGNLGRLKGHDVLLEALALLGRPAHLTLIGSELATQRAYARRLKALAAAAEAAVPGTRVTFAAWQDPEAVRRQLAACDLFVLPSRSEACPLVLLEALAMGCPCVAADVGDVSLVVDGVPGAVVVAPDDAGALARGILRAASQPAAVGADRRSFLRPPWRGESVALATLESYESIA